MLVSFLSEKWTQYFLETDEIMLLRTLKARADLARVGDVLDADVGVVTGQNDFFIMTQSEMNSRALVSFCERIVTKSNHLLGLTLNETDWAANVDNDVPAFLLRVPALATTELPNALQEYIAHGEQAQYHTGYKCRIRSPWYVVPSVWTPDAFMLRQVHAYPKIVLNRAEATCTDTIHCVRFHAGVQPENIAKAFVNSLTLAFAEVTGRSYGGGVLTFEPSEVERLPLPLVGAENLNLGDLDVILRTQGIVALLDITDHLLLQVGLGLTVQEVATLRGIWTKLRDRRIKRRKADTVKH